MPIRPVGTRWPQQVGQSRQQAGQAAPSSVLHHARANARHAHHDHVNDRGHARHDCDDHVHDDEHRDHGYGDAPLHDDHGHENDLHDCEVGLPQQFLHVCAVGRLMDFPARQKPDCRAAVSLFRDANVRLKPQDLALRFFHNVLIHIGSCMHQQGFGYEINGAIRNTFNF